MSVNLDMCRTFGPDPHGKSCYDCCNRDTIKGCRLYSSAPNRVNPYGLACARHGKPLERGEVPWMDRRGKKDENDGPCAGQLDFWGNVVGE